MLSVSVMVLSAAMSAPRRDHISPMSNFPPYNALPACTPLIIIPAISDTSLSGYFSTTSFMLFTQAVASPSLRRLNPSMNMNFALLAPIGKRSADRRVLAATSSYLSALKAS